MVVSCIAHKKIAWFVSSEHAPGFGDLDRPVSELTLLAPGGPNTGRQKTDAQGYVKVFHKLREKPHSEKADEMTIIPISQRVVAAAFGKKENIFVPLRKVLTTTVVIIITPLACASFEESKTITRQRDAELFKRIYKTFGESASQLISTDKPNFYYSLSADSEIFGFYNFNNKSVGGWQLQPFADPALEPEITEIYNTYHVKMAARTGENFPPILGCLAQNPLRYGDFTGDSKSELVIYGQDEYGAFNASVFSPEAKKIIFSLRMATYDTRKNYRISLPPGEEPLATDPLANAPTDGQYLSHIAEENSGQFKGIKKAVINFSKMYFFDADNDSKQDLIVWRKLYQSRENKDSIKGYALLRDQAIFYKLENGEYKKQPIDSATVKGWLTTKQFTWQKGYPSKSECKGQEGQLIPEFHDPLLNDPDVLK